MTDMDKLACSTCPFLMFAALSYTVRFPLVSAREFQQISFRLEQAPRRGPLRLTSFWYSRTRTLCAKLCMNKYPDECKTFMFSTVTGKCIPGSWIRDSQPLPGVSEGDLYHSFYCNESEGFRVYYEGTTRACIGIFGPKLNYTESDAACIKKGAFLMSVKTIDKLRILVNIFQGDFVWVGCDAIDKPRVYVWKEDGELLTNQTVQQTFLPGDPNYFEGKERCVCLWNDQKVMIDYYCENNYYYACEISIP